MISFALRKLYVDVVDEQGSVWIFYFVDLRCLGFRRRLAGIERYPSSGPPVSWRVVQPPCWPDEPREKELWRFGLNVAHGSVEFAAIPLLPAWVPHGAPMALPIKWRVVAPRLAVTLRVPGSAGTLSGLGYADFVDIRGLPRSLGLRTLRWGRAHGPNATFAFTSVQSQHGAVWQRAALWKGESTPRQWDQFQINEQWQGLNLRTAGPADVSAYHFQLGNERVLRQGDTIDPGRFPRAAERLACRVVMGPATESRWTGSARLAGPAWSICGTGIHESVDFGRRPPA